MRALLRVVITLPRALDADLLKTQRLSLSEYSTLMRLSEAPERQLRMSELADAAALSLSGMTRIVFRLERDGLVRRDRCPSDARVLIATLTTVGWERLAQAWPDHVESIRRHALQHLGGLDLADLTRALSLMAVD